jgi:glutamate-1-semialdehyde 2,1-aminomutase
MLVDNNKNQIAALILEPVVGNMGCVLPADGFLQGLRDLCDAEGIVLIFDEVMTGFRLSKGGAQERFGITPDLTTLGKIIGGGMPVGAYGGKAEIMNWVSPLGPVYQAGTLSGNPIAMSAGYATLKMLNDHSEIYSELQNKGKFLANAFQSQAQKYSIPLAVNQLGSMISIHFCEGTVNDFEEATKGDNDRFKKFFHGMLEAGIYLPPSAYESWFLTIALTQKDLDYTVETTEGLFKAF